METWAVVQEVFLLNNLTRSEISCLASRGPKGAAVGSRPLNISKATRVRSLLCFILGYKNDIS